MKKVKSFNVDGKQYSNFHEDHDEHHSFNHNNHGTPTTSQTFYVIDPEALRNGRIVIDVKDKTANPAALGLLGFGLTTFLLNMHNAGVYPLNSMILAMGFCYGGLA